MTTDSAESTVADSTMSRIDAERAEDQRIDARSILVIFSMLVLGAVYFVSGWTPGA